MTLVAFLRRPLGILLAIVLLLPAALPAEANRSQSLPEAFRNYVVQMSTPELLVAADDADNLTRLEKQRLRQALTQILDGLVSEGLASAYGFDETAELFKASLSDLGRRRLQDNPLVASVEPDVEAFSGRLPSATEGVRIQEVSSVSFIQVNSPFVWGRVSTNGLSVQLVLLNGNGDTLGVPTQGTALDSVKIDRTQLYYETIFVDPVSSNPVTIRAGHRVRVTTTGIDTVTGLPATDERTISVDDVQAWTSLRQDMVTGIAPANSSIIVTVGSATISRYLTPGTSMTYRELTAGPDGRFSVSTFRNTSDTTLKPASMQQGATGFVRVRHADGNEVYTIHGQNVFVPQNSLVAHGYAFPIPAGPASLDTGVTITRPKGTVTVTLRDSQGQIKKSDQPAGSFMPYTAALFTILPGDTIEVDTPYNQAQPLQVPVALLSASVDLTANQVTGTGPANTLLYLGAGRISGYITKSSAADFLSDEVTTDGTGAYSSGQFQCGQTNSLALRPGSFGYAGYEDSKFNFIYTSFAAPTNYVMSDFPFIEGWVAKGTDSVSITITNAGGLAPEQLTVSPLILWMQNEKLFINNYYNAQTANYIMPGDSVTVASGGNTYTIPVDRVTAYVNTDTDTIEGEAPAGMVVKVIPASDRSARREAEAASNGTYVAGNPFTKYTSSCTDVSKPNQVFNPGDSGRAYVRHADGNEVFTSYGRSVHILENENTVDAYTFASRDTDWWAKLSRKVTLTHTPRQGSASSYEVASSASLDGKAKFTLLTDAGQKVLIRVGDSLTVSFDEGPTDKTRAVTLSVSNLALITATPDVDTGTLAGVGPRGWGGRATLNAPPTSNPAAIAPSTITAYAPVKFTNSSNSTIAMVRGYSGTVSFTSSQGHRIWTAWAVTAYTVKISGWLKPDDTRVCGKAPPGAIVRIHDVTTEGRDLVIGTGSAGSDGNYCVTVNPPLYENQVLMAEVDGSWSQPAIVTRLRIIMLPNLSKL